MPKVTGATTRKRPRGAPLQAGDGALRLGGLLRDARAAGVELGADLGQLHAARRALEELRADALLERGDLLRDGGARLAELLRGRGEAARLDHLREEHHLGDGQQARSESSTGKRRLGARGG